MNKITHCVTYFMLSLFCLICPSCIDSHEYSRSINPLYAFTLDKVDIDGHAQYHIGLNGYWDSEYGSEGISGIAVDGVYLYLKKSRNSYSCIKMDTVACKTSDGKPKHINDIFRENRVESIPSTVTLLTPQVFFDSLTRAPMKE